MKDAGGRRRIAGTLVALPLVIAACGGTPTTPSPQPSASVPPTASPAEASPSASASEGPVVATHWETTGPLNSPRIQPAAALLADGRVLVVGDDTQAELWDPQSQEWTVTASLNNPRTRFALVALRDGRALVTGGLNDADQSYSSAYVFEPEGESWTKVGLMDTARTAPMTAALPDGRVLVAGGYFHHAPDWESGHAPGSVVLAGYHVGSDGRAPTSDIAPPNVGAALATAEIFDPATGTWSTTGAMSFARMGAAVTALADGRILIVGTSNDGGAVDTPARAWRSAEIYDPATGEFTLLNVDLPPLTGAASELMGGEDMYTTLAGGTLVALPDGNALLFAAQGGEKHGIEGISRSFRLEVATGRLTELGPAAAFSTQFEPAGLRYVGDVRWAAMVVPLPDGRILVAGGEQTAGPGRFPEPRAEVELYAPATNTWTPLPPMPDARLGATPLLLDDGSILFIGGHRWEEAAEMMTEVPFASVERLVISP